jgi:hypothetical protein
MALERILPFHDVFIHRLQSCMFQNLRVCSRPSEYVVLWRTVHNGGGSALVGSSHVGKQPNCPPVSKVHGKKTVAIQTRNGGGDLASLEVNGDYPNHFPKTCQYSLDKIRSIRYLNIIET